jgi:hypothetical protein
MLFHWKEYWFAAVYLTVDLFPAAVIVWHKFQTEKSWKALVSFQDKQDLLGQVSRLRKREGQ